jgi:hypothetical protein
LGSGRYVNGPINSEGSGESSIRYNEKREKSLQGFENLGGLVVLKEKENRAREAIHEAVKHHQARNNCPEPSFSVKQLRHFKNLRAESNTHYTITHIPRRRA